MTINQEDPMTAKPGTTNEWLEDIAVELHGVNERLLALTDAIRERRDAPASPDRGLGATETRDQPKSVPTHVDPSERLTEPRTATIEEKSC